MKGYTNNYVPPSLWGKDHWSTLAYVDTVMTDTGGGFEVGADAMMRSCRRHLRVMVEENPSPKRVSRVHPSLCRAMSTDDGSRLSDGTTARGHDDWHCLGDMAEAGYFREGACDVKPGEVLRLSPLGRRVVNALREHKSEGGVFHTFVEPDDARTNVAA